MTTEQTSSVVDPESTKPEWWENLPLGKRIATTVDPKHFDLGIAESQSHCANMVSFEDSYPLIRGGRITGDTINLHVPHRDGTVHSYHFTMDEKARKVVELNDRKSAEGHKVTESVEVYGIFRGTTPLGTRTYTRPKLKPKLEAVKQEPGNVVKSEPVTTSQNDNNKGQVTSVPNGSKTTLSNSIVQGTVSTCTSTTKPLLNVGTGSKPRGRYVGRTDPRRYRKG